jgi:hypothetical protein
MLNLKKSLEYQIYVVVHTMYINDECFILIFQLHCHICFDALKHIHPISSKCD